MPNVFTKGSLRVNRLDSIKFSIEKVNVRTTFFLGAISIMRVLLLLHIHSKKQKNNIE